ncbi:hypothetical protein [Halobacillus locisalis]|nr:hypothetical protein [Halobacillus locisalis]
MKTYQQVYQLLIKEFEDGLRRPLHKKEKELIAFISEKHVKENNH